MSTYNAFYVQRYADDAVTRAAVLKLYPHADVEILPAFIGAILSRDDLEPPEHELAELSAEVGADVIWVTFQTTAESFVYLHWRSGALVRALMYGCATEGTWDRVEGQSEPWEAEAFWSEDELQRLLDDAESLLERERLKRTWENRTLGKGQTIPFVSSADAVHEVMEHFALFRADSTSPIDANREIEQCAILRGKYGCLVTILVWIGLTVLIVWRILRG